MSDSLTNDIRQEANTALLEVDKGLYQILIITKEYHKSRHAQSKKFNREFNT